MTIQLFRVVKTLPPTRDDFLSSEAQGKAPINSDPEVLYTRNGISTFTPLAIAQIKARKYRRLGSFLAELRIPEDVEGIRYERTFISSEGHYTIWGDPDVLLGLVVAIYSVESGKSKSS